jgi:hypothetical protein
MLFFHPIIFNYHTNKIIDDKFDESQYEKMTKSSQWKLLRSKNEKYIYTTIDIEMLEKLHKGIFPNHNS